MCWNTFSTYINKKKIIEKFLKIKKKKKGDYVKIDGRGLKLFYLWKMLTFHLNPETFKTHVFWYLICVAKYMWLAFADFLDTNGT